MTYLETPDLVCFSHLRWNFVFQRPQHLMTRFARTRRVFFVEEPVYGSSSDNRLIEAVCLQTGVRVLTPHLAESQHGAAGSVVKCLLSDYFTSTGVSRPVAWFYSPMWLDLYPEELSPRATIYDCMDELSLFKGAPPQLQSNEMKLLKMADLVFTGGVSLFEHKKSRHARVYPFPSGVDIAHFAQARGACEEPEDQRDIPHPRLGFAGVIDERMDLDLIREVAKLRPEWNFIMIGPVVKIDPATLPQGSNLHWLGMKDYRDLPTYFAGWDAAIMPFAMNDSTRFISPTKTPEFLAAGLPVVSTPVRDVVRPYGELGLARIASTPREFVEAADQALNCKMGMKWRERADAFLETMTWDSVWLSMNSRIQETLAPKPAAGSATVASRTGEAARV